MFVLNGQVYEGNPILVDAQLGSSIPGLPGGSISVSTGQAATYRAISPSMMLLGAVAFIGAVYVAVRLAR